MKLVVQIPCLNEEATLARVLEKIPKKISGIDDIVVLIIDDGSSDKTVAVARKHGVKHFVFHAKNQGLGRSFHDGVNRALELGADIVVNTDGDDQFPQEKISELVQPILKGHADLVIADRNTSSVEHYSALKKWLQRVGTRVVNTAADTNVPDAVCGFRAYSKQSLLVLNTITRFSYCTETIIQAGNKKLAIASIPITVKPPTRPSRLFQSMPEHVLKTAIIIIRAYIMYKPYIIFGTLGSLFLLAGSLPFARYLYFVLSDHTGGGHLQSLIVGSLLLTGAFLCLVLNIIADLVRINRILIEDSLEQSKRLRFGL